MSERTIAFLVSTFLLGVLAATPPGMSAAPVAQDAERAATLAEEQARCAEEWGRAFAERFAEPIALLEDEESGWLGVTIEDLTAEKAKELKLPEERGVLVRAVSADSPAAKAGLKAGDVVLEFNGQRVEGTVQFRRLVRETPAGRTVQLVIWREGGSQRLTAKLGPAPAGSEHGFGRAWAFGPHDFDFGLGIPQVQILTPAPLLGIEAEEIGGQLASYFGVPDGAGVLIREVRPGSPAEKAGLKAGDVITKANGERVRTIGDLRSRLRQARRGGQARDQKSISISAIRRGAEMSFQVELEATKPPEHGRIARSAGTPSLDFARDRWRAPTAVPA